MDTLDELNDKYNLDGFEEYVPPAPKKKKRGRPKKFIEGKELVDKLKADLGMNDTKAEPPAIQMKAEDKQDMVKNPAHYTFGGIETWDFITSWGLDFCLGSAVKYISRAGHKGSYLEDIGKAKASIEKELSVYYGMDTEIPCKQGDITSFDFIIAKRLSYPLGRAIECLVNFPTVDSLKDAVRMIDIEIEQEAK